MSDPFLLSDEGQLERECARMRMEIKTLREENLRLRLTASSHKPASIAPSVAESTTSQRPKKKRTGGEEGNDSPATSVAAAAVSKQAVADARKYREAAERAALEKAQVEQQYSRLSSQFELFVTAACEREAGCKRVYHRVFEELAQERETTAQLRRLLEQEREQARVAQEARARLPAPPLPTAVAAATATVGTSSAVAAPPLPPEAPVPSPAEKTSVTAAIKRQRPPNTTIEKDTTTAAQPTAAAPTSPPKRVREDTLSVGGGSDGSLTRRPVAFDPLTTPVPLTVDGQAPAATLNVARGAGALRSNVASVPSKAAKTAKPRAPLGRPPSKKAAVLSAADKALEERRALLAAYRADAAAQAKAPSEKSEATTTTASPTATLGADTMADYLRDPTRACAQALRRQSSSVARLVQYLLQHLRTQPRTVTEVWQVMRAGLQLGEDVAAALPAALAEALVAQALVTPVLPVATTDVVDHTAEVRTLALALRFTLVQQGHRTAAATDGVLPQQWVALALYDLTVGVLRARRAGRSPEDGPAAKEDRGGVALRLWTVAATHLCGSVEEVMRVLQSHTATEADAAVRLPPSLVLLVTQALLSSCAAAEGGETAAAWCHCCDALGWSRRQLPLEQLAACAASRVQLTSKPQQTEALLALRLIVLYKGFGALQALKESLQGPNLDAVFAELFSYAVMDWNLNDPRDRQWQIVVSFFDDYLQAATEENYYSVHEMVQAAEDTHVVVLRALLQLCTASRQAAQEAGGRHLATALTWMQRHLMAAKVVDRSGTGGRVAHPLRDTATGRELASMLAALSPNA